MTRISNLLTSLKKLILLLFSSTKGLIFFFGLISVFLHFLVMDWIFPLSAEVNFSPLIVSCDSVVLHAFLTTDDKWRMMTELEEITPQLRQAIVYKEDKYFYYHFGINPIAILRAIYQNSTTGSRTSGASTITMQVVRMLEPKQRNYANKLIELFRALQLEFHFSKDEILQLYLNLVPYGSNIEGVKAASILYLDKSPDHLSLAEITALSIIPNRPTSLVLGANNDKVVKERNKWLNRFLKDGVFIAQDIENALEEPLNAYRHNAPKIAPHFSLRIKNTFPDQPILRTTLKLEKQLKIEKIVQHYIQELKFINIHNAAVVVVNNSTHAIEAYVGSADYYDTDDGGQVDGIKAIRSPGSTLKPLLYGIAFESGLLTPKSIISDVPINFSGYEPENYDGKFYGNISIEYALSNSLNVPAVKVLDELKSETLIERLVKCNFQQIDKSKDQLGLSLVLGGCGVTLEELCGLYAALANQGNFYRFRWLQKDTLSYHQQILSPEATFMVTEILTKVTRPDLPYQWQNSAHLPKVAWKTGTSYGRKDAWSIGYNKDYTIGVWVGNFSSQGVPELSGSHCAAPLLFSIFNTVDYNSEQEWYSAPEGLDFRLICSDGGKLPESFCTNQIMDFYIPGVSSSAKCDHIKYLWISPDSSMAYCSSCLPASGYIKALFPNFAPEIIQYFESNQVQYEKYPEHNPDCERIFTQGQPHISSPLNGAEYFIDENDSMQVMLSSNTANDVDRIYWYINNAFYVSAKSNEKVFFSPTEGKSTIVCADDKGRKTSVIITVKKITF